MSDRTFIHHADLANREPRPTWTLRDIAVVVIGRNEGDRLRACFDAIPKDVAAIIYVDSGSTDDSVECARARSVLVHELDMDTPFTAARARNAGVRTLQAHNIDCRCVQFIDGDCVLLPGWLEAALCELDAAEDIAVVCGRCREANRDASIYNRLCDMEWNTPVGDADACGGNALMRLDPFIRSTGFNDALIAGEEPELCLRLRRNGWRICRIDHDMVEHEAQMKRFGQWWRRSVRCGHAYALAHALHGDSPERFRSREIRSIVEWTLLLPLLAVGLAWATYGISLLGLLGYALLFHRVRKHRLNMGDARSDASLYAMFCVIGKFAELFGLCQHRLQRVRPSSSGQSHVAGPAKTSPAERAAA